jgi:uncharacterized protein (TIGR03066 family)
MNRRVVLGLVCLLGVAGGVGADEKEDAQKLLVGRWEVRRKLGERELRGEMSFTRAGKVKLKMPGPSGEVIFDGTWKLLDATKIEITYDVMGAPMPEQYELKVTTDTLELTGKNKSVQRMTRKKAGSS